MNPFGYVEANPLRWTDVFGLANDFGRSTGLPTEWKQKVFDDRTEGYDCEKCECWLTCLKQDPLLPELLLGLGAPLLNLKTPGEIRPGGSPWTSVDRRLPSWTGANPNAGATVTRGTIRRVKCVGRYGTVAAAAGAFAAGYSVGAAGRCWVECL